MPDTNDWRDRLSDPPKPHTLPELILLVLDMASEDAETAEADYSDSAEYLSARAEFKGRVGYDLYDEIRRLLAAPIFSAMTGERDPRLPTDYEILEGVDTNRDRAPLRHNREPVKHEPRWNLGQCKCGAPLGDSIDFAWHLSNESYLAGHTAAKEGR